MGFWWASQRWLYRFCNVPTCRAADKSHHGGSIHLEIAPVGLKGEDKEATLRTRTAHRKVITSFVGTISISGICQEEDC
jgi:hypothetical protein